MRDFRGIHVAAAEAIAVEYEEPTPRRDRFERWRAEQSVLGAEAAEIAVFLADRRRIAAARRSRATKKMIRYAIAAALSLALMWFEPTRGIGFVAFVGAGFFGLLAFEGHRAASLEID